jgi:hypothetical protein
MRRNVGHFYSIIINPREIKNIYYKAADGKYYTDPLYSTEFN